MPPRLRSRGRQRKPTSSLSPQDEKLEDQDAASLDEIKDEKRKADFELDALCTQTNYLLYEADFDKASVRQVQEKLVKVKAKIFGVMTELRGVYRTRGEHRKADDVEVDMDLYQSRVGKVLQEVGDKLKESAKRAVKPESDKDSFETENLQKWLHGQSHRAFEAERFPERTIDETPAQTLAKHVLQEDSSRFFHSKSPERKQEAGTRSNLERITVPKFNGDKTKFERFWTAFSNCVDKGCESSEIKMLRLESCLVGKAADTLEGLDYSETAYATAKMRLQRKFGGPRRQVQNQIEKLRSMKPLHADNVEDLEKFSDALKNIVVLLQTQGKLNELQPNSSLYTMSLEKIPEEMLSQYYRWLGERRKLETLEVFKDWILDETDYRVKAAEAIKGLKPSKKRFETHLGMVKHADQSKGRAVCRFCKTEGHEIWKCEKFKALHTDYRWKIAKDQALCFRCLSNTHKGSSCRRFRECGIDGCKSNHHRLLHAFRQPPNPSSSTNNSTRRLPAVEEDPIVPSTTGTPTTPTIPTISQEGVGVATNVPMEEESSIQRAHTATLPEHSSSELVSLRTVPVWIKGNGKKVKVNAVLDDASTGTFLNEEIAIALGLQSAYERVTVRVLNETVESFETMPVEITLESVDGQTSMALNVYTCPRNVTGSYQAVNWNLYKDQWSYLSSITFPEPAKDPIVDILIGVEYSFLHSSTVDLSEQDPKGPVASLGPLGWSCIGSPNGSKGFCHKRESFLSTFLVRPNVFDEINANLKKFWEVENSGVNVDKQEILTPDKKKALAQVQNSLKLVDGRYQLEVPWKNERPVLPDNYTMALKRLENTELKLLKHSEMAQDYQATITSYLQQGYIRKLPDVEMKQIPGWLLPHFPVFRPERQTTKTRIVFDASAKHKGVSLNDEILPGPKLQKDLVDILLRFRRNPIALVADISQMYLRIQIAPPDRRYFRFLWRDLDMTRKPEVYEFERVVFGKKSAPFEAQYTIQEHARKHQKQFPAATETVLESTYMDDSMDSTVDEQNAIDLYHQLSQLWEKAGMHARKWLSNSTHVLREVPQEDRLSKVDFNHEDLPSTKTLGVVWIAETDVFTFNTKPPPTELPLTKRNVLKNVATLFDPLGLVTPYTIRAKILLQVMWTRGLDWDEGIGGDLTEQVQQWFSELDDLKKVQVHRCLQPRTGPAETTIHTFVDASKDAFGAVSYVRNARLDGVVETRFIASKTKVAPLATMSIPRLELSAAVMGLRLAQSVSKVLQMEIGCAIFWSDSTNTLWWIRGNGRCFKPFVANRVGEIQAQTDPVQWRYVPTSLNPADLCSRGSSATQLAENTLWWHGPSFLKESEELWPRNKVESNSSIDEELKKSVNKNEVPIVLSSMTAKLTEKDWRLEPTRFSSWTRLTRIHAWILRFVQNCQSPSRVRKEGELSPQEILESEGIIIKEAQKEAFPEEYRALTSGKPISKSSKIIKLTPRLDEDGIIRCDGRLQYTEFLPFDVRFPIILPRGHWVTKLIVKQHHDLGNHVAGTNHTLANLSARYWIVSAREEIREWENQCNGCKRRKGKAASQLMGPLPKVRLRFSMRAFAQTAVDYGGPFITIQGRGKARLKRWLCLFTCLSSRAIHCEMAFGLDTDSFLNAFARMVYRRGLPQEVVSDRGTNFIGANRELKELVENLDKDEICQRTANRGVTWIFNPPQAPHFGGAHEIMIKAAKKAIHAVLGEANVTDEELMTAFIGAESLLNSRPITYQTANPCDETPLTPNHFLYGQVGGTFAPDSVDETEFQPKKRWRRVQELISHFWRRWLKEWLPCQNVRSRWNEEKRDLKVGDVVLAISSDLPRAHWPLGRITEIYQGKDNHVRVAKVQVGQNSLLRPVNKLIHLDVV